MGFVVKNIILFAVVFVVMQGTIVKSVDQEPINIATMEVFAHYKGRFILKLAMTKDIGNFFITSILEDVVSRPSEYIQSLLAKINTAWDDYKESNELAVIIDKERVMHLDCAINTQIAELIVHSAYKVLMHKKYVCTDQQTEITLNIHDAIFAVYLSQLIVYWEMYYPNAHSIFYEYLRHAPFPYYNLLGLRDLVN